mmetsp:Transcript_14161/g.56948  ORF Transcript_14161/g.56948 Transcript_14161/m.56948 type:complete len:101 (+) Transcript_14161:3785-4087(+)
MSSMSLSGLLQRLCVRTRFRSVETEVPLRTWRFWGRSELRSLSAGLVACPNLSVAELLCRGTDEFTIERLLELLCWGTDEFTIERLPIKLFSVYKFENHQ